jgi:hypothetical protein
MIPCAGIRSPLSVSGHDSSQESPACSRPAARDWAAAARSSIPTRLGRVTASGRSNVRRTFLSTFAVTAVLLAGCGTDDGTGADPEPPPEQGVETEEDAASETEPEDAAETDVSEAGAASDADSEAGSGTQTELVALTEDAIVDALSASDLPVTDLDVFDAETDPNSLLGRPGQYTIKVSWEDGRLTDSLDPSGTIEVFPDVESMQRRADYVEQIGQDSPMLLQWIFTDERTGAVLRVSSDLTPDQAAEYEAWLQSLV